MYLGSFGIDDYVGIPAATHRFSSGAAYAPTSLTYSIYEEATTTGIDEDVDMTVASPFDSITGCYWVRRQLTTAAGFEAGKNYLVVVKATVDSVAAIQMHTFQVAAKVDARYLGGTSQTGRDVGASVLLSAGSGAGQLDFTSGVVKSNLSQILGTALTETAGLIAAGFKKFFNVGTPTGTLNSLPDAVPGANGGLPTTNGTKVNQTVDLTAGQSIEASQLGMQAKADVNAEVDAALNTAIPGSPTADSINERIATIDGLITAAPPTATENADALLKRDMSAVTGESARSPLNALRLLRNKWSVSAGTLTVTKEDDATSAWTAAVSSDAAANPITGSDPA